MKKEWTSYIGLSIVVVALIAIVSIVYLDRSPTGMVEVAIPAEENIDALAYTVTDVQKDGDHVVLHLETTPEMSYGETFFVPFTRLVREMNPDIQTVDVEVRMASDGKENDPHYIYTNETLYADIDTDEASLIEETN